MTEDRGLILAGMSLEQRAELERRLLQRLPARVGPSIPRRPGSEPVPLSFGQERQWFFDQLHPGSPMYNIPKCWRLTGPLDADALQQTLDALAARHEVLRTRIVAVDGVPYQAISPQFHIPLPLTDLGAMPRAESEAEVHRLATLEAGNPFDLAEGPLVRGRLLRLAAEEHVLLLTLHHIVTDGWSMGVLFREMTLLYEGFAAGRPVALPELPIQYGDYARWQRRRLDGGMLDGELEYWRRRLDGAPSLLALPTDRPRDPMQRHEGSRVIFMLAPELVQRLAATAQAEGATLFMLLLAGCKAFLAGLSGQHDIVVGSPVAGRTLPEIEGLIGCFTNTLVLRTDLSGDPSLRELIGRVRETTLAALAHQELPFERLVKTLRLERNLSYHPLFQVLINYRNYPVTSPGIGRLRIEEMDLWRRASHVDVSFTFRSRPDGTSVRIAYDSQLFDPPTVERFARQYQEVLTAMADQPERRLSALPVRPTVSTSAESLGEDSNDLQVRIGGYRMEPEKGTDLEPQKSGIPEVMTGGLLGELESISDEEAERLLAELRSSGCDAGPALDRS